MPRIKLKDNDSGKNEGKTPLSADCLGLQFSLCVANTCHFLVVPLFITFKSHLLHLHCRGTAALHYRVLCSSASGGNMHPASQVSCSVMRLASSLCSIRRTQQAVVAGFDVPCIVWGSVLKDIPRLCYLPGRSRRLHVM